MVVLDTCALIELCQVTPRLKANTNDRISAGACILSISFAEIACKIKLKKLTIGIPIEVLYEQYNAIPEIDIVNIDVEHWLAAINLNWTEQKDPADRLIVAFADKHACPIVTSDLKMKQFYKKILW